MTDDTSAVGPVTLGDALVPASIALGERVPDRESAVRRSGDLLVKGGRVDPAYTDEMLGVLSEYGPYIVLAPGVALAHARPGPSVHGVAFSILTLEPPVAFGHPENDPVSLVVGMAAPDDESHVEALRELADLLSDDERRERLSAARTPGEVLSVVAGEPARAQPQGGGS